MGADRQIRDRTTRPSEVRFPTSVATASGFSEVAGCRVAREGEKPLAASETRARGHGDSSDA